MTCALVDLEDDNIIGLLVAGEKISSVRCDLKMARRFAAAGNSFHKSGHAARRVDGKDGDAVVTAVRRINELAAGMHPDFCCETRSLEALLQS